MTNPDFPDGPQAAVRLLERAAGWPWPQIGLMTFNLALFLTAVEDLLPFLGMSIPEWGKTLSGLLMGAGLIALLALVVYWVSLLARKHGGEIATYSPRMRWLNWGCFGGTVAVTMLSLIIPAVHSAGKAADRERAKQAEKMNPDAWHTVRSAQGAVVDVPTHWVESANPEWKENDVVRVDATNDLLFFLESVPKEDVTYAGLDAWADAVVNGLRTSMAESEVIEKTTHERQGRSEIELYLEATNENTRLTFFMRFLETPSHYAWARAVAKPSAFREHEETLRRIVRSVRVE